MVGLKEAALAVTERKHALGIGSEGESASQNVGRERMMLMLSGFDVDEEELRELLTLLVNFQLHIFASQEIVDLASTLSGIWTDGLITGMMLMKLRRDEEVAERGSYEQ